MGNERPAAWHKYQDYKTKPHYRAFALSTDSSKVDLGPNASFGPDEAWAFGRAWRFGNVEDAIEAAMENCKSARKTFSAESGCMLYAIGDHEVFALSKTELDLIIARYRANPEGATTGAPRVSKESETEKSERPLWIEERGGTEPGGGRRN
jgi:hypothetical protein